MPQLPLECVEHIVRHVDSLDDLCQLMHVNKLLFFTAARCIWYEPLDTVNKTKNPDVSLLRLIRLIYAISPSEDDDVNKVRQFFAAIAGSTTSLKDENMHYRYEYDYEYVLQEPFERATRPPLLDYLSFIAIFDVFAVPRFHPIIGEVICAPLYKSIRPFRGIPAPPPAPALNADVQVDAEDISQNNNNNNISNSPHTESVDNDHSNDEAEDVNSINSSTAGADVADENNDADAEDANDNNDDVVDEFFDEDGGDCFEAFDLFERTLAIATFGHRLPWMKRLSLCFRHLPYYLDNPDPAYRLTQIEEMIWDMAPRRSVLWGPSSDYDDDIRHQILSRIQQCRNQFQHLHTVEPQLALRLMNPEGETELAEDLYKHLPPLPSPKKLCRQNCSRIFAQWRDTDMSQIREFEYTSAHLEPWESKDIVTQWLVEDPDVSNEAEGSGGQSIVLQRCRSLRTLEFEPKNDTVFSWAVQERQRKERGEAIQLVPLQSIIVQCDIEHIERLAHDAALAFGDTLQQLVIRPYKSHSTYLYHGYQQTSPRTIRIGEGWHLPYLSKLVIDVQTDSLLEIDPSFLAMAAESLTHLELVDGSLEEDPLEEDEVPMPELRAPWMGHLRLVGSSSIMFDPASLSHMSKLEYLELCDQVCIFECEFRDPWRWQEWSFPLLKTLRLTGSSVSSFPWFKMAGLPQLHSALLGVGGFGITLAPWLGDTEMTSISSSSSSSSLVRHLVLKGSWNLPASTLRQLVGDLLPNLRALTLRHCKGHDSEALLNLMKEHRHLIRVGSTRACDFLGSDLKYVSEWNYDEGTEKYDENTEEYRVLGHHYDDNSQDDASRFLILGRSGYLLPSSDA